jgi:hypothetical protein
MPMVEEGSIKSCSLGKMHHGDIYIYLNRIYLYDDKRWYKANIQDIKEIKTILPKKQILIQFWNFDIVLCTQKYSHLLALRDFLNLSQNYLLNNNVLLPRSKSIWGRNS